MRFFSSKGNVYELRTDPDGREHQILICSDLSVQAYTRDRDGDNWGKLLEWQDRDGRGKRWVMPQSMLADGPHAVIAHLLAGGLMVMSDKTLEVIDYIQSCSPRQRITIATQTGWHSDGAFVLPDQVIGAYDARERDAQYVEYAPLTPAASHNYRVRGSLEDWQLYVAALCSGNPLLLFAVSLALSGPVLALLSEEAGGFHVHGPSSVGKSTCQQIGGSAWGGGGQNGFSDLWRATSNGLEFTASVHNDTFLALDELALLDAREAVKVAYMLAGGQSKMRMNGDSTGQQQRTWRLQFLSSGEVTMDALAATVGERTRGGMETRLANIPADAGHGLGVFADLHKSADPDKFSCRLREAAKSHYGTAGRAFVKFLVESREDCTRYLKMFAAKFEVDHMPDNATGEVRRVIRRFAVVAAAGELATMLDVTGWEPGEAEEGVFECLKLWLAQRGTGAAQGHDADQMIRQVREFLQLHGGSRFRQLPNTSLDGTEYAGTIYRQAGYKRFRNSQSTYYCFTEVFRSEICKGFDHKQVLAALKAGGHLVFDSDRTDKLVQIPPRKERLHFYAVRDSVFTKREGTGEAFTSGN
jgi:putative DNA primase/helicase